MQAKAKRPSSFELNLDDDDDLFGRKQQPVRKVPSREDLRGNEQMFKPVPKSQYSFLDSFGPSAKPQFGFPEQLPRQNVLPDIKPSAAHYAANTR